MKKCAFLSMDCLDEFEVYDALVEPYLAEHHIQVDTVSWRDNHVNWDDYEMVVIRTPWDYQDAPGAFISVLETITKSSAYLENTLDIVRWNIDKCYLKSLGANGVNLIPTLWCDKLREKILDQTELLAYFTRLDCDEIILKPRISANADNTFWLNKANEVNLDEFNAAFEERDYMVQPFVKSVIEQGEYSLFYFNGEYSHTILKTPKQDDFRVQEEHGGRLKSVEPMASLVDEANQCMLAIENQHTMPLYARLDFVLFEGRYCLMEAELIEPSLYFNMDEASAKRFADAMVERIKCLKRN